MRLAAPLTLVLILGLAAACGGTNEQSSTGAAPTFEGKPWVLASGIHVAGLERVAPSARFLDGELQGFGGCNEYEAPYTLDGESLEIGRARSTLVGCAAPGGPVEEAYFRALPEVAGWRTEGSSLVLLDGDDNALLTFEPGGSVVGDWQATAIQTGQALESPRAGADVTATFATGGTLTGSGGCNTYRTTYVTAPSVIHIQPPVSTKQACPEPAGASELEAAYLAALLTATHYRVRGPALSLLTSGGTVAVSYVRR